MIELHVPPLRERLDDVPQLVDMLLDRGCRGADRRRAARGQRRGDGQAARLRVPGQRARAREHPRARGDAVLRGRQDRAGGYSAQAGDGGGGVPPSVDDAAPDGLEGQLESIEREAIVRALEQTRYNKTKAAQLLGMTFRQLRYRRSDEESHEVDEPKDADPWANRSDRLLSPGDQRDVGRCSVVARPLSSRTNWTSRPLSASNRRQSWIQLRRDRLIAVAPHQAGIGIISPNS